MTDVEQWVSLVHLSNTSFEIKLLLFYPNLPMLLYKPFLQDYKVREI